MIELELVHARLFQVLDELPPGFSQLRNEAREEGFDHIERLAVDWASGALRFEGEDEMLIAAESHGELAGLGGLTIETALPHTLRLRRFYVRPKFRGAGIARAIVDRLIHHAHDARRDLTLNALTPEARAFWERLGFTPDARLGFTHRMVL